MRTPSAQRLVIGDDSPRASHAQDLELVRSAVAGDRRAREALAERLGCVGRMVAYRNRRLGFPLDDDELRDLTNDVVVRVLTKLGDYAGRASFESWVYVFCDGELRNTMRKKQRAARHVAAHEDVAGVASSFEASEPVDDVAECLEALAAADRQLMRWKHFDDLTLEDIGHRSATNLNTVKSRYWRALQQLRRCLERKRRQS